MQPALEDGDCKGEMDELSDSCFHKSSFHFMEKTSHRENGTEDSAHSQEFPIIIDDSQSEKIEGRSNLDGSKTIPVEVEVDTGKRVNIIQENSYGQESEPKNDDFYLRNSPTENGIHVHHSHPQSSEASPQTVRQMSVSPEISQHGHQSASDHRPLPLKEGIQEPSHPPTLVRYRKSSSHGTSSRHRHSQSSSPKRSGQAKEVPFRDYLSSSRKQTSPRKQRSASSKSRDSPRRYRRLKKSVSRSPVRQNDSSFVYKRGYRCRSRSRSPHKIDYHRSSRARYSPRRRSSPRHHSSRYSPQHRPWFPPPNRITGLGEPGNNLFVAGFSFPTTETDLERKFSRFGRVRDVRIVRDKRSRDSRGFGFLSLERDEDADAAIRALDETEWNGRIILVEKSKSH